MSFTLWCHTFRLFSILVAYLFAFWACPLRWYISHHLTLCYFFCTDLLFYHTYWSLHLEFIPFPWTRGFPCKDLVSIMFPELLMQWFSTFHLPHILDFNSQNPEHWLWWLWLMDVEVQRLKTTALIPELGCLPLSLGSHLPSDCNVLYRVHLF